MAARAITAMLRSWLQGRAALRDCYSIAVIRERARRRIPRFAFDYLDGGAEDEAALARNCAAWTAMPLNQRVGRDVAKRDTTIELFGRRWAAPFGVSPTGLTGLAWPSADLMIARAAAAKNVPVVLSTPATATIEEAAAAIPDGHLWFQLYVPVRLEIAFDLMRRAEAAGIKVLIVTMDVPVPGKRERDQRNGFVLPLRPTPRLAWDLITHPRWSISTLHAGSPLFVNIAPYAPPEMADGARALATFIASLTMPSLTWEVVRQLREAWKGNFVVKGILHPQDADEAVRIGADGLIVSNHGGRQLDAAAAPFEVLPAVVDAVGSRLAVMVDGGVRRGSDIVRAVLAGARFVFAGRPTLYGSAAGGEPGAARALTILLDEFDRTIALMGCRSIDELQNSANPSGRRAKHPIPFAAQ